MYLANTLVTAPSAAPTKWIVFLHGVLGSGGNFRTFARDLVAEEPSWGAVLVDLRLHGRSLEGFPPPHTIANAAADVVALLPTLPGPTRAISGHSLGGKVAIAAAGAVRAELDHLFVIDSTPARRPELAVLDVTRRVLDLLAMVPRELPSREALVQYVESNGITRPIAMWLAMNVVRIPGSEKFTFRIDVPAVESLLADFLMSDEWDVIEHPGPRMESHLVLGGQSGLVPNVDVERMRTAPRATVDVIPGAGHWVHVDAHDKLLAIVHRRLIG